MFFISLFFIKFKIKIPEKIRIMDPGHGGNVPGSIGLNETREKEL